VVGTETPTTAKSTHYGTSAGQEAIFHRPLHRSRSARCTSAGSYSLVCIKDTAGGSFGAETSEVLWRRLGIVRSNVGKTRNRELYP
jgi:hypothetical protein